jgi:4-alpha-glucanotransferase
LLDRAYKRFQKNPPAELAAEFEAFQEKEKDWLLDFTLFMAIKQDNQYAPWDQWPEPLRLRLSTALDAYRLGQADQITNIAFRQFLFFRQWDALHKYANQKSIAIIGDIPIFVAFDSADAWANKELFYIDPSGQPSVVAGVPPDYFSPTGQLWGNPLYRWSDHKASGYEWWIKRLRATLRSVDIIRLDHFRGFGGYWEVPFGNTTAEHGRWVQGPGADLFNTIQQALGTLPIIAEDLGEITQDVIDLRDQFSLPGMKVLQFSFLTDPHDPFMPHNFIANSVCYTGTHDNDTSVGWFNSAPDHERDFCRRYFARSGEDIAWDMIRAAWESVSVMALAPMQDVLRLGTEARMNYPGRPYGNWTWRMPASALSNELAAQLREYARLYNRLAKDDTPRPTRNLINYEQAAA